MRNTPPGTLAHAQLQISAAWLRLLWEVARGLGNNQHFGVPDEHSLRARRPGRLR